MQLEWMETRLAHPGPAPAESPSHPAATGVELRKERRPIRAWQGLLAGLLAVALLGEGEHFRSDPRFHTPSATLTTYWSALGRGDVDEVWECFVEGRNDLPLPGTLWFLPPVDAVRLGKFHSLPVTRGRVLVSYEVRYIPRGFAEERSFRTGDELVQMHGSWRISQPLGQADMPHIVLPRRSVDI